MSHTTFYPIPSMESHRIGEVITPVLDVDLIDQVAHKFVASLNLEALKAFNGRLERGLELAKNGAVQSIPDAAHPRRFLVRSSDGTQYYKVDSDARTCECPDSQKGHTCKHRIAAYYIEQTAKLKSQVSQAQPTKASPPVKPTCSVMPPQQPNVKPTCSIPPTRKEFEQAEKRVPVNPTKEQAEKAPTARTEEQILKELGFDSEPKKVQEKATESPVQLGNLYRRYLHGSDLGQNALPVTIQNITKERVCPHPSQPVIEKWCLWVYGLPEGMPNGILFGARGEEDLIAIFGKVSLDALKGKPIIIYPKPLNVAGQSKVSIRFMRVQ